MGMLDTFLNRGKDTITYDVLKDIYDAARIPGDVISGQKSPESLDLFENIFNLAGMVGGAAIPMVARRAVPNTLKRARQLGFNTDEALYHGTINDFPEFDLFKAGGGLGTRDEPAIFLTPNPRQASEFANAAEDYAAYVDYKDPSYAGPNVMPLFIRPGKQIVHDMRDKEYIPETFEDLLWDAREGGYDSIRFKNVVDTSYLGEPIDQIAIFDPKNIRSRFAQFDPQYTDEAGLLLSDNNPGLLSMLQQKAEEHRTLNTPQGLMDFLMSGGA